jgi:glycine oxidase
MGSEVLIIGGGAIGMSIARELHRKGVRDITILEKQRCGEEASWAAAGMLSPQVDAESDDVFFQFCCESRNLYPAFADELLDETAVDIELDQTGTLSLAFDDHTSVELLRRYRFQKENGLAVENLSVNEILNLEPNVSPTVKSGLLFPNDWQVENRKLLSALRGYAELNGISIRENTRVDSLIVDGSRVAGARSLDAEYLGGTTILATGAWTSLIKIEQAVMPVKVEPVRGQIVCFRPEQKVFRHVIVGPKGYLVPRLDGRILAGSTSENVGFEKAATEAAAAALTAMSTEMVPVLSAARVADQWSGLRPFAADALPVIGGLNGLDDLTIATGHYRNGILLAPITANLVAELVVDRTRSNLPDAFTPDRFKTRDIALGV